jgi:hypothetical protein
LKAAFLVSKRSPRLGEPHRAVADAIVKEAFKLVLHARTELAFVRLGPEVLRRTWRAADRERDQMIFLDTDPRFTISLYTDTENRRENPAERVGSLVRMGSTAQWNGSETDDARSADRPEAASERLNSPTAGA